MATRNDTRIASASALALRIKGDALYPAIKTDTVVIADPADTPTVGELVLIERTDGSLQLREYRGGDGVFVTSAPPSGGGRETVDGIARVMPIAYLVFPSHWARWQREAADAWADADGTLRPRGAAVSQPAGRLQ